MRTEHPESDTQKGPRRRGVLYRTKDRFVRQLLVRPWTTIGGSCTCWRIFNRDVMDTTFARSAWELIITHGYVGERLVIRPLAVIVFLRRRASCQTSSSPQHELSFGAIHMILKTASQNGCHGGNIDTFDLGVHGRRLVMNEFEECMPATRNLFCCTIWTFVLGLRKDRISKSMKSRILDTLTTQALNLRKHITYELVPSRFVCRTPYVLWTQAARYGQTFRELRVNLTVTNHTYQTRWQRDLSKYSLSWRSTFCLFWSLIFSVPLWVWKCLIDSSFSNRSRNEFNTSSMSDRISSHRSICSTKSHDFRYSLGVLLDGLQLMFRQHASISRL